MKIAFRLLVISFLFPFSLCLQERNVTVGELCGSDEDCGDDLLYCAPEGVCLCDERRANFVYEYHQQFTVREPKCEVLPCTLAKDMDDNECNLRHALCLPYPGSNDTVMGYCKCPHQQVGARRRTAFSSSHCKEVTQSTVGEKCISNMFICNVTKKLKCRDGVCECYPGHLFNFDQNICVREEHYIKQYGYEKLGTYGQYCSRSSECLSGMFCKSKRCDCPNFCRSEKYIKKDEVCYCSFDMTRLAYIIPSIIISILFTLFFIGFCYFNRKYEESLQAQSNLVLVHARQAPASSAPHYIYQDNGSDPMQHNGGDPMHQHVIGGDTLQQQHGIASQPARAYSALSMVDGGGTRVGGPLHKSYSPSPTQTWKDEEPQQLSGAALSAQLVDSESGKYSFYPPPPYQLNERVAAEVVEAQMRQSSPSSHYHEVN